MSGFTLCIDYIVAALYVAFYISCSVCRRIYSNRTAFHSYSIYYNLSFLFISLSTNILYGSLVATHFSGDPERFLHVSFPTYELFSDFCHLSKLKLNSVILGLSLLFANNPSERCACFLHRPA